MSFVTVAAHSEGAKADTVTDAQGRFRLPEIVQPAVTLFIGRLGYETQIVEAVPPVKDLRVRLVLASVVEGELSGPSLPARYQVAIRSTVQSAPRFIIALPSTGDPKTFLFSNLPEGTYVVDLIADHHELVSPKEIVIHRKGERHKIKFLVVDVREKGTIT